ncbi:UNVERIFIED_CONTAM: hypothetical protein Sradi_2618000 [Sesamum radiatum]|uniref:Reverse transcriptase domain-containing protein n=1 Tax=Sesamum radiatum TaxID=300843 RepID=A0AAW2S4J8_SESRA
MKRNKTGMIAMVAENVSILRWHGSKIGLVRTLLPVLGHPQGRFFSENLLGDKVAEVSARFAGWGRLFGRQARDKIAKLERALTTDHQSVLTEEGKARRARDKEDITKLILQEEVFWKQRSKDLWLRDGDWNSSFFHAKASHRHQTNVTRRLWQADGLFQKISKVVASTSPLWSIQRWQRICNEFLQRLRGDPLSPYLFLFCTKSLSSLFRVAEERGTVLGVAICRGAPSISHLLFVDDTMVFCPARVHTVVHVRWILETYKLVSGQEINLHKSSIVYSHKIPAELQEWLADELGIRLESTHAVYLGLSTLAFRSKLALFAALKDHIWRRIQGWHEKHCLK